MFDMVGIFRSGQGKEAIGEMEKLGGGDVVRFFGFGDEGTRAIEEDDVEVVAEIRPAVDLAIEVDVFVGLIFVDDPCRHESEVTQMGFEGDLSDPGVAPSPLIETGGGREFKDLPGENGAFLIGFD